MIITIEVKEADALRKICALSGAKCQVFTWTAQVSKAQITEYDGSELSAKNAWLIASSFRMEVQIQELNRVRA